MTKSEFVAKVAEEAGISKTNADDAVNAVIDTLQSTLTSGGEVVFTGFGKFHVTRRNARQGINPQTGERIQVMRHVFGLRQGYKPLHTQVAPRALGRPPQERGPTAGVTVEVENLLKAYLEVMEWDSATAIPSPTRLTQLGLSDLVSDT